MEVGGSEGRFEMGRGMRGSLSGWEESEASMSEEWLRVVRVEGFSNPARYSRVERRSNVSLPGRRNQLLWIPARTRKPYIFLSRPDRLSLVSLHLSR